MKPIYMTLPVRIKVKADLIRRLNRFLYGLKQDPKVWNLNFDAVKELNFRQLSHDRYLYIHGYGSIKTYLLLNVNDIILVGTDERDLRKVKAALSTAFCMSDLKKFHCFLRIKVKRGKEETKQSQTTYIQNSLTIWYGRGRKNSYGDEICT